MRSHLALLLALMLAIAGCSKKEETPATTAAPTTAPATAPAPDQNAAAQPPATASQPATTEPGPAASRPAPKPAVAEVPKPPAPVVIPAGTTISIRTTSALGSEISQTGDTFSATVLEPIELHGKVVVPKGADVSGKVVDAQKKGKIKGEARLQLTLTSLSIEGQRFPIQTTMTDQTSKGKGKRTAATTAGGAGLGAIVGGIAGGGKGAGIGALVGGGAGLVGGAFTATSKLKFRLSPPLRSN